MNSDGTTAILWADIEKLVKKRKKQRLFTGGFRKSSAPLIDLNFKSWRYQLYELDSVLIKKAICLHGLKSIQLWNGWTKSKGNGLLKFKFVTMPLRCFMKRTRKEKNKWIKLKRKQLTRLSSCIRP